MKRYFILTFVLLFPFLLWSEGQSEAASSATRGKYLAGAGTIIPEDEVHINAYIAHIDYKYTKPDAALGVTIYTGNKQVSAQGQEEIIHIGIQAEEMEFKELPPMNLAFVIDKSGSMDADDKMVWVKEAFTIFIQQVRDIDFVSLIVFDSQAQVLFPSTGMNSQEKRLQFQKTVKQISPGGSTNLVEGLKLGYKEVFSNYRKDYTNRVLFLTDGVGDSEGILEMAETYEKMGINVSTIGVGMDFDLNLMVDIAKSGGGSSRFISDKEEMEKTFGSELDRMVVPAARNLDMTLEFIENVEILGTWGYRNNISGNSITYYLPTLHHRDYETILTQIRIPKTDFLGKKQLAQFFINYNDMYGKLHKLGPYSIDTDFVKQETPITGFSNGMVLKSGTMLHFAKNIKNIGKIYYSSKDDIDKINNLRSDLWTKQADTEQEVEYDTLTTPEIEKLENSVMGRMKLALALTIASRKELLNVRLRLDNEGFDDEIEILDKYIEILGGELKMEEQQIASTKDNIEIRPPVQKRSVNDHLENLFREMVLDLDTKTKGNIAISGFLAKDEKPSTLIDLLNEMAVVEISKLDNLQIVERDRLDEVLKELELSLSDLMDTNSAIKIGGFLAANYILTGTLIEMSESVVIFGRIINVQTGEVESVAQVIIEKDNKLIDML